MGRFFILSLLFWSVGTLVAFPVTRNGKPAASIEIAKNADMVLRFAAEELQKHIRLISGATLPVVEQAEGPVIRLAVNPEMFAREVNELKGSDGFGVAEKGSAATIFGATSKGVLNGVYRYLRANTDIIWARPDETIGTIYSSCPTLDFKNNTMLEVPAFHLRGYQMIGPRLHQASELWQVRQGTNWSAATSYDPAAAKYGSVREFGGGHNLNRLFITEKKYYDKHPDYFPLVNGKRVRPGSKKDATQLCFSNEAMTAEFIRILDDVVRANPDYTVYRVMIEDNYDRCRCPRCEEPIRLADGSSVAPTDPAFYSTRFFLFLNKLAAHFEKRHPGRRILTFAYFFTEIPPKIKVHPVISISFCPIYKDGKYAIDAPQNKATRAKLDGWLANTHELIWREYYGLVQDFPRPTYLVAGRDYGVVNQLGLTRTYSEMYADSPGIRTDGIRAWDANGMSNWIMANSLWRPNEVEKLKREYLTRVFGPAASDVNEYYNIIAEAWPKTPGESHWHDNQVSNWNQTVFEPGHEKACRAALARAENKIVHPKAKLMLERIRRNFEENAARCSKLKLTAKRISRSVTFDPSFQSEGWKSAPVFDGFTLNGGAKQSKLQTELRMLYDDRNLYLGIRCLHSDVKKMPYRPATPGKNLFPDGEGFECFLSGVWGGKPHFTQVVIDPANNRYNGVRRIRWISQAQVTSEGWSGMITVPWSELGISPGDAFAGAFVRQHDRAEKPGHAPKFCAMSMGGARHSKDKLLKITFQP